MAGTEESGSGRAGAGLRQAVALAVALAAVAVLSLVVMAWVAFLRGDPVELPLMRLPGTAARAELPEGAVIAVAAETCPYPWQEYLPAQGRFVLGAGSGAALNLDDDGVLVPVRRAGAVGGETGVELQLADLPPHTHRLAVAEVPAGHEGMIAFGVEAGSAETLGVLMPFRMGTSMQVRTHRFTVVEPLETVGGVITSDRRFTARRHANIPPFVALTFCTNASDPTLGPAAAAPRF